MFLLAVVCTILRMLVVVHAEAQYFIITPNVIRVDVEETILVNMVDGPDGFIAPVTLYFQLSGSNEHISETSVTVGKDSPQEVIMRISREQLAQHASTQDEQFVTLVASAGTDVIHYHDRRTLLLSYQTGFVFIQTDKPLYTPTQRVDIRVVALDQNMVPDNHELQVDIVNPDQLTVRRYNKAPEKGFVIIQFDFPPLPVFGNWTVIAYYGHQLKANTSIQFEVKEYVLPKFSVTVSTQEKYIVPGTSILTAYVNAKYFFGEPVFGSFVVRFGVYTDEGNLTILQRKQGKLNSLGMGIVDLEMDSISVRDWAQTLMGKRLVIEGYVTDSSTGETINTNNTDVTFSTTPYKFNWDLTPKFFKKGLPFAVKASIHYKSGLPAVGINVAVSAVAELANGDEVVLQGDPIDSTERQSGPQGELDFRLDVLDTAEAITLTLETKDIELSDGAQGLGTLTVLPEESINNEYMLLRLPLGANRQVQKIGATSSIDIQLTNPDNVHTLHYFVIAGGKIVHRGVKRQINKSVKLNFPISHEMVPSSRVVAYYMSTTGHIVADALLMEVAEMCENPIHLQFENMQYTQGIFKTDGSNKNVMLRVGATEETTVGLLAVDEAVYALRNYHRLTQKKVFKRMAGYDLGCGPGGGQTVAAIFKDAGVGVLTNADLDVPQREALGCQGDARRSARSLSASEREDILNSYGEHLREYCEKGMRQPKSKDKTCKKRAKQFALRHGRSTEDPEIKAFLDCCLKWLPDRGRTDIGDDLNVVNLRDVLVRTHFDESWMFIQLVTGEHDYVRHPVSLPDSATTWVIEAIGVSEFYDMCVADPVKLQVRPPFFLDLSMPYSVQRFEQIEIIATVFNYADVLLQVKVYLKGVESLCSEAPEDGYSQGITINVLPKKPASVKFVIVPLEAKRLPIEVVAVTNSSMQYRDGIRKYLTVRAEGYRQRDTVTAIIDPENIQNSRQKTTVGGQNRSFQHIQMWDESKQIDIIRYTLNDEAISDTHNVHVSLVGSVMGSVVETVIGGLENLLRIPKGCGEQTMLYLAPNIYIYKYLKHTRQFTATLETLSSKYISDGVAMELAHRRPDGSFSIWGANPSYPSSTWLTAFVSKVMCQAREFAYIDDSITCNAMEWLITQTQENVGSFRESYRVHHAEMTGGVQGTASLTAYVLIALTECSCERVDKKAAITNATSFLEAELPSLTRPYAVAITAYALALAGRDSADEAILKLKDIAVYNEGANFRYWSADDSSFGAGPKPYWYSNKPEAIEVETTSYALLALLKRREVAYTHAIVNWLTNQENYEGGFVSTQDTVIALQALSEYAIQSFGQHGNVKIDCSVSCPDTNFESRFTLRPHNAIVRQHSGIKVPETRSQFTVRIDSQGEGQGQLKFESTYHIPEPDSSKCAFDLIINGHEGKSGDGAFHEDVDGGNVPVDDGNSRSRVGRIDRSVSDRGRSSGDGEDNFEPPSVNNQKNGRAGGTGNEYIFEYDIKIRYLRGDETGMAIVDVGLYTGFHPLSRDLEDLKAESNDVIQRYEVTDRSVIFYLTRISKSETTRIKFGAQRTFNVGKAQPVAVRVYDYYNPTIECVKFVYPHEHGLNALSTLCEGDTCICAAGVCAKEPASKPAEFVLKTMKEKMCKSEKHFAYELEVTGIKQKGNFQYFSTTIINPIKRGLDRVDKKSHRTFWKSKSCGIPKLKKKKYLVIGSGGLETVTNLNQTSFKYVIDEKMSFYEWPTGRKATVPRFAKILDILRQLSAEGSSCPS